MELDELSSSSEESRAAAGIGLSPCLTASSSSDESITWRLAGACLLRFGAVCCGGYNYALMDVGRLTGGALTFRRVLRVVGSVTVVGPFLVVLL